MVPAGTPAAIVDRLNRELASILALPETQDRFKALGIEAKPTSPKQMDTIILAEIAKWGKVIREARIEAQ